jgi:hypothetical protein
MESPQLSLIVIAAFSFFTGAILAADTGDPHVFAEVPIESDGDGLTITLDVDGQSILTALELKFSGLKFDSRSVKAKVIPGALITFTDPNGGQFQSEEVYPPKILKLGEAPLKRDSVCAAIKLDYERMTYCRPIQAVIGLSEFRDYIVEFDWDEQTLRLRDDVPEGLVNWVRLTRATKDPIPSFDGTYSISDNQHATSARVTTSETERLKLAFETTEEIHDIRFALDSSPGKLQDITLLDQTATLLRKASILRDRDSQGQLLQIPSLNGQFLFLDHLKFGNVRDDSLLVSPVPASEVNRLNIRWLLRHHLAIDQKNRRVYLGQRKQAPPLLKHPYLSGIVLRKKVQADGQFFSEIIEVKPNSVAELAGIQVHDEIVQFNGRIIGQFRLFEVFLAQWQPESQHTLRIRRGIQEFDVLISITKPPKHE